MKTESLKKFITLLLLLMVTFAVFPQTESKIRVLSYYAGPPEMIDKYDVSKMTHIIFCFGHLKGNRFSVRSPRDTAVVKKMVSLKEKNPGLKVLLSL